MNKPNPESHHSKLDYDRKHIDKSLICYLKPHAFESEMFKILRENVLFSVLKNAPRLILITSVAPGEGKTFIASNLAISIAQNMNNHVLLIDCDLRKPCIHKRFGYQHVPGLSEHLSDGRSATSLLLRTMTDNLIIFPAGKPHPNPADLLASKRLVRFLREVKRRYSDCYVIIDAPPPHFIAETRTIARLVDGIILVAKYGGTPREMIADLIKDIGKEKVLGTVINWFNIKAAPYYRYGKYKKYKKKYKLTPLDKQRSNSI